MRKCRSITLLHFLLYLLGFDCSYIHRVHSGDVFESRDKCALMAVSAVDLVTVLVGYDLRHGKRYPYAAVKRLGGEYDAVFKPFEAEGVLQVLVNINPL